jgi:hypothetical protein
MGAIAVVGRLLLRMHAHASGNDLQTAAAATLFVHAARAAAT